MDLEVIYLVANVLFTIGGWDLGKRIWASKGADPGRGRWYGASLGFLLGFIGILTLVAIAWRWHPASEPPDQRAGRESLSRAGAARVVVLLLLACAVVLAAVTTIDFLADAERYSRWSVAMSDAGIPVTRADCAEVTLDWDACFVLGAAKRTDTTWRSEWGRLAQEGFIRAGMSILVGALCTVGVVYLVRRQRAAPLPAVSRPEVVPPPWATSDWPSGLREASQDERGGDVDPSLARPPGRRETE